MQRITFAVAVNNREILEDNFLASPCFHPAHTHEILLQTGFRSAALAYNDAIERASNDLVVFAHQDLFLPGAWMEQLTLSLDVLEKTDPNWGVLGCWGVTSRREFVGHLYSNGLGVLGAASTRPAPVQTLDEVVLILRKSSGLRFDTGLPHFHLYGSDICLSAANNGMKAYALSAFCVHNTRQLLILPPEFYECCKYMRRRWWNVLPVHTACITISRSYAEVGARRLRELYLRAVGKDQRATARRSGVAGILAELTPIENTTWRASTGSVEGS
jgi:hypothetical protein